ncbi:Coatomer subunit beta [Frankliniella fusca]|uniref:Coatomer subunit beta n=1 Tax=Frankliniella fusca TaxID=407009 RepID=A0AAE1GP32_9NEOP|nr:Coatomer subunit beta [Frankliniella fusca]
MDPLISSATLFAVIMRLINLADLKIAGTLLKSWSFSLDTKCDVLVPGNYIRGLALRGMCSVLTRAALRARREQLPANDFSSKKLLGGLVHE